MLRGASIQNEEEEDYDQSSSLTIKRIRLLIFSG